MQKRTKKITAAMSRADVGSYSAKIIGTRSRARTPGVLGHYVPSAQTTMILAAPCPPPSGRPTHRGRDGSVPKPCGPMHAVQHPADNLANRQKYSVALLPARCSQRGGRRTANYRPRTVDGGRLCHDRRSRATCPTSMHWTQSSYSQSIHDGRRDTRSLHSQRRDIPMSGSPASTTSTECTLPPNPIVALYFPTR